MPTKTDWIKNHKLASILAVVGLIGAGYLGLAVRSSIHDALFDRNNAASTAAGQKIEQQVVQPALQDAGEASGARKVYEQEYKQRLPERQRKEAAIIQARRETKEQEQILEALRTNYQPGSGPIELRERRAAADARALFPGTPTHQP